MISKVKEMAVFSIGVGLVFIAIVVYLTFLSPTRPGAVESTDYHRFAVLLIPGVTALGLGLWILSSRSATSVRATTIVLGALFLLAGLFPFNIPTIIFGILVVAVLRPSQQKALEEIRNGGIPAPKVDNLAKTEESPF